MLSSWESASRIAHPFLSEDFLVRERKNISDIYLPKSDTWVVEVEGRVVGFVSLMGNEVGGIFLEPDYHGRKLGKRLMDKASELQGDLEAEVFERNLIGRRFYARYGFEQIAETTHEETGERVLRLRYSR